MGFKHAETEPGRRAPRKGPSRFYAYFLSRAYERGYSDAITDAKRIIDRAKRPARPDLRWCRMTRCPWCRVEIQAGDNTARHYGTLFHSGCLEDLLDADSETEQVREATK